MIYPISVKHYLKVIRLNHWFKNILVFIGLSIGLALDSKTITIPIIIKGCLSFFLACLMSSANYIINEIADAPFDKNHPEKKYRPVASRSISVKPLISVDILLVVLTLSISYFVFNINFFVTMFLFFIIGGLVYNIPPIRAKDIPCVDIVVESLNSPLRLMLGWYVVNIVSNPPLTAIICFWAFGAALATAKRLAEYRFLGKKP